MNNPTTDKDLGVNIYHNIYESSNNAEEFVDKVARDRYKDLIDNFNYCQQKYGELACGDLGNEIQDSIRSYKKSVGNKFTLLYDAMKKNRSSIKNPERGGKSRRLRRKTRRTRKAKRSRRRLRGRR
jgi:hypothetical protein